FSLAHQASARLEHEGDRKCRLCLSLKAKVWRRSARLSRIRSPVGVRIVAVPPLKTVPGTSMAWDRTPLGLQTVPPCRPRAPLALGGAGKAQESSQIEGSGAARVAERDTTGSISRQPPVHTWIGRSVQGMYKGSVAE